MIFNSLFKMISPILDPVTKEKIKLYSGSKSEQRRFLNDLKSHISEGQLPKEYGGSSDIPIKMPAHAREKGCKTPKPFSVLK